jgi:hypothetical protein
MGLNALQASFSWHDLQSFARAVKALDTLHRPLISVKLKRLEDRLGVSQWPGWGMGCRRNQRSRVTANLEEAVNAVWREQPSWQCKA